MGKFDFQYCQKIVVLSKDRKKALLCKRRDEADFNEIFSFIGGKMETTDSSIVAGVKREKDEEVGDDFKVRLYSKFTQNLLFVKKDGSSMVLPHYLAIHESGDVALNEEYSEYRWVSLEDLEAFEPKISNISRTVEEMLRLEKIAREDEFVLI